jgi:hypothetical protein
MLKANQITGLQLVQLTGSGNNEKQHEAAALCGTSPATFSKLKFALIKNPDPALIKRIADHYHVAPEVILRKIDYGCFRDILAPSNSSAVQPHAGYIEASRIPKGPGPKPAPKKPAPKKPSTKKPSPKKES